MNILAQAAILLGLPAGCVLAGYWLAGYLRALSAAERFAVAALAGLAAILWNVTVVNLFTPLTGMWAGACVWPMVLTLLLPVTRHAFANDVNALLRSSRGHGGFLLGGLFLVAVTWPVLRHGSVIFYDGTSNHDSFFWIAAAEFLKRNTYLTSVTPSGVHPVNNAVNAIIGWKPVWGRMGAEGLLALVSSLTGTAVIKIYVTATATLFLPWVSGVFLAVKTFVRRSTSGPALGALLLLQPIFVFFHGNSNLPNLLGILMGSAIVVATEQALRKEGSRWPWLVLLALGFHGLMCVYPEMVPFVLLPAGLLWLRRCLLFKSSFDWRGIASVSAAFILGALINPASTVRAYVGFVSSFATARANQNWANLFQPLTPIEFIPAMTTLCVAAGRAMGPYVSALFVVGFFLTLFLLLRKARDTYGTIAMLAGTLVLVAYTIITKFNYGWQKAVQFGGVFCAAIVPVAFADYLSTAVAKPSRYRPLLQFWLAALLIFCAYATELNITEEYKWSKQKVITQDWFRVREFAHEHLRAAPVLIEAASFRMAFFHGMWATYFLPDSDVYFGARGKESGGYIRDSVISEASTKIPAPRAYLVGRDWADTIDANSPRLFSGDTLALIAESNRVVTWQGFYPDNGVPTSTQERFSLVILPHRESRLLLTIAPSKNVSGHSAWDVVCTAPGHPPFIAKIAGPAPWNFNVPLIGNVENKIEIAVENPTGTTPAIPPYAVKMIRVESMP